MVVAPLMSQWQPKYDETKGVAVTYGAIGSGVTSSHTYTAGATYSVTLTVTDATGSTDASTRTFVANAPPIAAFTETCSFLTCTFDASGSSDVDGSVVAYAWHFGDGQNATGMTITHTFTPGPTTAALIVTDSGGAASSPVVHSIQAIGAMHIGDLDRSVTSWQNSWTALVAIEVHDAAHQPLLYATVTGVWNDGTVDTCETGSAGRCGLGKPSLPKKTASVTFTVQSVTRYAYTYTPAANHDPDGDSNGTKIVIAR